jgi:hypothetical protein
MLLGLVIGIIGAIRKSCGAFLGPFAGSFVGGLVALFVLAGLGDIPQTHWVLSEEFSILNIHTHQGEHRLFQKYEYIILFSETATGLRHWTMNQKDVELNNAMLPFELGAPGTCRVYRLVNTNSAWDNWNIRDETKYVLHLPGQNAYSTLDE